MYRRAASQRRCGRQKLRARGLVLPGYACTSQIWRSIRAELDALYDITWVDWPCELTAEFHSIAAFAHWLRLAIQPAYYDFVIGHSLGGLVALEAINRDRELFRQVILVEAFLMSPPPFFRSLFLSPTLGQDERLILDMMERERAHYSPRLRQALRQVDMSRLVASLSTKVQAFYGDRGCGEPHRVERELAWPGELQHRVQVSVVSNAAHFPMIENPRMTTHLLHAILG